MGGGHPELEGNKKISLYSLYLRTVERQYSSSLIEDSEVVLVCEHNNEDLKEL
jgi:hypothetical protein